MEQANRVLGGLKGIGAGVHEYKGGIKQKTAIASSIYKTYKAAKKMEKQERKE